MALIPFAVLLVAYQFGWYGFATIAPYCGVGFLDLLLPGKKPGQNMSRMEFVDGFVGGKAQQIPSKGCGGGGAALPSFGNPPPAAKSSGVTNCPPGMTWVGDAANGGCVSGGTA